MKLVSATGFLGFSLVFGRLVLLLRISIGEWDSVTPTCLEEGSGRRNRNSKSSSDFDSDYEPPDYVQDEILEKTPFYTRSMTNQRQKEESLKRILENKINRYPLRQYLNLGTGFEIHLRPNYQESDLEEEYERKGRRRHSISAPFSVEDEEENGKKSNLKTKVRRCSEGSNGYLDKKENANIKEASTNFQGTVSITRTLTYTSKKQIIKFYQTEHLNATPAKCELQDIVNKFKCGIEQIDNDSVNSKNNKHAWFKEQPSNLLGPSKCSSKLLCDIPYKNRSNIPKEMEIYRKVQKHRKEKVNTHSTSNTENYFFAQLGLKRQAQTKKNYTHLRSKLQLEKKNGQTRTNKCKDITKKSKSCSKNVTPLSEPFSFQNNKHQLYNMSDVEYKLKCLFGKEENKKLQEERINVTDSNKNDQFLRNNKEKCHGKTSDLEQAKFKDKRSQYCYLHKQKVNFWKIKREREKLQSRKEVFRSLKPTQNIKFISKNTICSLNKEVEVRNIREKIETLKEKRQTLYRAKMVLKKILCSKETCVRASNSLPNTFRGETNRYESEEKFQNRTKRNSDQTVEIVQGCCLPPAAASSCSDVIDSTVVTSTAPSLSDGEECVGVVKPCNNEKINNVTQTDEGDGTCSRIFLENMFPDESEEDQDLRDLIATLADSIDTSPSPLSNRDVETENKSIDNNSHKLPTDVQLDMTGMEHYKKRLIHQHEKPGGLSSPCTTTEEEDDSLESPLSPTSSVQSRESIQQDKRRDDVVQKVARKRAVCRSQFRHRNMELFKLGSSIPTSLCKTKEPYNVCTEKNLQMCYQNGGSKKCDKNPSKGSLTESIISTIEGGKRKDVPLWRSVSLNNEISERQNAFLNTNTADNKNVSSGRHILPAIVPELPERRKSRIKSLPESGTKNNDVEMNKSSSEALSRYVYEFVDNDEPATSKSQPVETITEKPTVKQKSIEETRENESFTETHAGHANNTSVYRHSSTSSESDIPDCAPINLSLKKRETVTDQPTWTELFNVHQAKRGELNNNQHLTQTIPKQPSNVPKKPVHVDQNFTRTVINENLETSHVDKDGNCFFVTAIPSNALDPQKQSNVIVINFPHIQQQMSRMEKPNVAQPNPLEAQQSPLEMLDSAIMSLINIVKSSVESVFNILSLPVLNRLYIDLNRYLLLPTVSVKMKACIEDALNALISYLLVNLFHAPRNSKARDFVHKILQLDLRPHMDFLINSLDIIQQKIKYEYFMDHLLKVLSRNPQEDFAVPLPGNMRRPFGNFPNVRPSLPPSRQYFSNQNQAPEFRDYPHNRFWMENQVYQRGNVMMPNAEFMGNVPQNQPHRKNRRQHQESDKHLLANMRVPENFNEPNLAMMRPDLYLADNRCIPPNISHIHSEAIMMNTPPQLRAKGRPRNSSRITKIPNKLYDNSLDLPVLPQVGKHRGIPEENQIIDRRERDVNIVNSNVSISRRVIRRNSDIPRDTIEDTIRMRNGPQILENRRLSEGTLLPSPTIENGANLFSGNNLELITRTHEIHKNTNRENNSVGTFFKDNLMNPRITTGTSDRMNISRNEVQNYADNRSKHFHANVEVPTTSGKAVMVKEIVQRKEQVERSTETASVVTTSSQEFTNKTPGAIAKHSDVEQFLQTNIIVNKHQTTSVIRGSGIENLTPPSNIYEKNYAVSNVRRSIEKSEENNAKFGSKAYQNPISNSELTNKSTESKTIQKENSCNKNQEESQYLNKQEAVVASTKCNDVSEVIASTVIIKDKSMEISKGVVSSSTVTNAMDLDDVVLERASPIGDSKHGISYCSSRNEGPKRQAENRHPVEKLSLVTDVSIEKVTNEFAMPPKLIKLASLKRKNSQEEIQQRKTVKRRSALQETNSGDIVVIEDEEKIRKQEKLDYNQNNVTKTDTVSEKTPIMDNNPDVASKAQVDTKRTSNMSIVAEQSHIKPVTPIIEDISSEEEVLEPFRLYSTYENKVPDDPRKILQTTEVSHCTLIEGNVKAIQNANRHLFEKPPVYTRPVIPRNLRKPPSEDNSATRREPLANMVQFKEDSDTLTCSLKVKNSELKYPSTIDVRRFSPGDTYQVATENSSPRFSPNFKSPPRPTHVPPPGNQRSPLVPTLPAVQVSPAVPGSPVVQTSPMIPKSPVVQTSPIVLGSPVVPQMSPIVGPPPLNESDMNWRHWFSEEQRKGVFNFERSHSMESSTLSGRQSVGSDYCSKLSPEEPLCEIKIDSKPYRIKKSLFEKIPRGKLCYIRESNTFVRYFDDNQMELFISNLNLGEGSTVASDLLKQIRSRVEGPSDIERSTGQQEGSGKGEVITLSKDVIFSTEDFLSDPELYVEEVEKVQRYVPKDFYGFYKFVTGYQIVNHHPPISFQTFLTMHNTNGIRGLFKNYVNTLAEGRNIL